LHGFAVVLGMIAEAWLSVQKGLLSEPELEQIVVFLFTIYEKQTLTDQDIEAISHLVLHDKKNEAKSIRCVLLKAIGEGVIDQPITQEEVVHSLRYYQSL
jgi:3-dehydroquinate synthase